MYVNVSTKDNTRVHPCSRLLGATDTIFILERVFLPSGKWRTLERVERAQLLFDGINSPFSRLATCLPVAFFSFLSHIRNFLPPYMYVGGTEMYRGVSPSQKFAPLPPGAPRLGEPLFVRGREENPPVQARGRARRRADFKLHPISNPISALSPESAPK